MYVETKIAANMRKVFRIITTFVQVYYLFELNKSNYRLITIGISITLFLSLSKYSLGKTFSQLTRLCSTESHYLL